MIYYRIERHLSSTVYKKRGAMEAIGEVGVGTAGVGPISLEPS